ncbi:MAG: ATP-binding protein [Promethearchaeota archaeon]
MIEKSVLFEILREQNFWYTTPEFNYIDRQKYLEQITKHLSSKSILVIQGPRRSGKTVLLKLLIKSMMESINKNFILYVNLEDYRLVPYYSLELLEKIYEVFREYINPKNEVYYIIDEIQNIDGFEHFLRTKYDNEEKIKFIITGSNSKLLSKELASLLTGRTLTFEIFPFSFKEYLNYQKIQVEDNSYYALESKRHEFKHLFNNYCNYGAIPEYLDNPVKERLEEYFENVILKDIVERYNLRNAKLIKQLGIYLLSNASSLTSYNSLSKTFDVSINTIKEYISYLEAAYLFFSVSKFSFSYKKHVTVPSKVYCIDNGLINLVSFKFIENRGKLFENLVFLELKRNKKEIYYHSDKKECDFILKDKLKITNSIQVTVSIQDEKTKHRELNGLLEAIKAYDLNEGLILTEDEYDDFNAGVFKIKVRPIWFWLLNKEE